MTEGFYYWEGVNRRAAGNSGGAAEKKKRQNRRLVVTIIVAVAVFGVVRPFIIGRTVFHRRAWCRWKSATRFRNEQFITTGWNQVT